MAHDQPTLDDFRADGETYEPERDKKRLSRQLIEVKDLMLDGQWRTLSDIAQAVGYPEASVSARLRDLRKERFGSYVVHREYISNGLYRYRVQDPQEHIVAPEPAETLVNA